MEMSIPRSPEINPFARVPSLTEAMRTIAIMIRVKYSKGPKRVAIMDNGFVIVAKVIQEISPPTKEAVIPSPSALPGLLREP